MLVNIETQAFLENCSPPNTAEVSNCPYICKTLLWCEHLSSDPPEITPSELPSNSTRDSYWKTVLFIPRNCRRIPQTKLMADHKQSSGRFKSHILQNHHQRRIFPWIYCYNRNVRVKLKPNVLLKAISLDWMPLLPQWDPHGDGRPK